MNDPVGLNEGKAEDQFLGELKLQFEQDMDLRKSLDSKATNIISVASGLATLLISIGTFLISRIDQRDFFYGVPIFVLACGVVMSAIAIRYLIQSYSLKKYTYPIGHEYFFKDGEYRKENVDQVRNMPKKDFYDRVFKGYLESIKKAASLNAKKAEGIRNGIYSILGAIISITFLVGFVLVGMAFSKITLH